MIAPAIANFFRPNAPNYFLAQSAVGWCRHQSSSRFAAWRRPSSTPGVLSPFGSVNAQISNGNSNYNALNADVRNDAFPAISRSVRVTPGRIRSDDSSDLQTLLIAAGRRTILTARGPDSLFDQRHRFVFQRRADVAGFMVGMAAAGDSFSQTLPSPRSSRLSSGKPFNIITNVDANNDQSTQTDRPSVNADGQRFAFPAIRAAARR